MGRGRAAGDATWKRVTGARARLTPDAARHGRAGGWGSLTGTGRAVPLLVAGADGRCPGQAAVHLAAHP
ncbi:MAG TPA: hypothetical protein DHU96_27980 [Actinobacteria bacterium]|nr:hypothetical protein [Actinomycetota bacterium]